MANPVLDAIKGYSGATQAFSAASRIGSDAAQSFDKGASIALKMDRLLGEEEARLENQANQAMQTMQKGLDSAINSHMKQQQLAMQEEQMIAANKRSNAASQLGLDKLEWEKEKFAIDQMNAIAGVGKNSGKKNTIIDYYKAASDSVSKENMVGLPTTTSDRHQNTMAIAHQLMQQQSASNTDKWEALSAMSKSLGQPIPSHLEYLNPKNSPAPQATLAAASFQESEVSKKQISDYIKFGQGETYNIYNGAKMQAQDEIQQNPGAVLDRNSGMLDYAVSGILSRHTPTRQQAETDINAMPPNIRNEVYARATEDAFSALQLDVTNGDTPITSAVQGDTPVARAVKKSVKLANSRNKYGSEFLHEAVTDQSGVGKVFIDIIGLTGLTEGSSETEAKLSSKMFKRDYQFMTKYNGVAPYATTSAALASVQKSFFSTAKNWNFGMGFTGSNLRGSSSQWKTPATIIDPVTNKRSATTMKDYMLVNELPASPKGSSLERGASDYYKLEKAKEQVESYTGDQKRMLTSNLISVTKKLDEFYDEQGYMFEGKYKTSINNDSIIKVPLLNMKTGKTEVVEMKVYAAVMYNTLLLSTAVEQ